MVLAFALTACEDTTVDAPIPQDKMQRVLLDVYILEKGLETQFKQEKRDSAAAVLYPQVFAEHAIDSSAFLQSLDAYMLRPDVLKTMHQDLLGEMTYIETVLSKRDAHSQKPRETAPKLTPQQQEALNNAKQKARKPKP